MLKYLKSDVVFQEIPDEMSLAIAISGCQIRCPACNQRELWENKGVPLTTEIIDLLLDRNQGVSCLLLMGGEYDIDSLTELFIYAHKRIKTAWYCGLDILPKEKQGILSYLDYLKTGHYDPDLGGLDSITTNQRLYKKTSANAKSLSDWKDITYRMRK